MHYSKVTSGGRAHWLLCIALVLPALAAACEGSNEVPSEPSRSLDDVDAGQSGVDAGSDASVAQDAATDADADVDAGDGLATFEPGEDMPAGTATTTVQSDRAFFQPLIGIEGNVRTDFFVGQALFELPWIATSATTSDRSGLGPTFNANSCSTCHPLGGRGMPPSTSGDAMITSLLRVSIPGTSEHGGPVGHPIYGDQIQPTGIANVSGEGRTTVTFSEVPGTYGDGAAYTLLAETIDFEPALGDPGADLLMSHRAAQPTIGMGLLEAVSEVDILLRADPSDADGDGISGKPNMVWNVVANARTMGRFGWKANQPTVNQQNSAAFLGDIGITTPVFPAENCPTPQTACASAPKLPTTDVSAERLAALDVFMHTTSVPKRLHASDSDVLRGKFLFSAAKCSGCHVPTMRTGISTISAALSSQTIWPYTDLLLHDMGEELADGRPDFDATGSEWRTPPLWGMSLLTTVNGHERLLHDGRARGVAEAILWHGGEGAASREAFRTMSKADRDALVTFVRSL